MKQPEPFVFHIIEAVDKIEELLDGFSKEDFEQDERTQLAIIKLLEMIGEACNKLEQDFHQSHPEIPWRQIISMRNRLTHEYWDIDIDIVWKTIQQRVPDLKQKLIILVKNS